jgi:hypothetical protein
MAKAVSLTIDLVDSDTSDYVNLFNFGMCAFTCKCFPIKLVPRSDGRQRTWWQMIPKLLGLPVSSIPQCKWNHLNRRCRVLFEAIETFEWTFIEVHQASNIIRRVRSFKSQIQSYLLLDDIITSSNEVFTDFESDIVLGIWSLCISGWVTVKSYNSVKYAAGSSLSTVAQPARKMYNLWDIAMDA